MEPTTQENYDEGVPGPKNKVRYLIPVSIILTGVIISVAVFIIRSSGSNVGIGGASSLRQEQLEFIPGDPKNVKEVNEDDHILGNPNAQVKIIEFSDFECPFCKVLHAAMWDIMGTYGKDGKVAWIYRHLPIDSIHTKAKKEAAASECAGEIGGDQSFWDYANRIFEVTPSNNNLDLATLPDIAEYIGVDRISFEECLSSGRYDEHIQDNFRDAVNSGANGTPYSVVVAPNGKTFPMTGSQSYATISAIIELALKERGNL